MRIYYSAENKNIVLGTTQRLFASGSLVATAVGRLIKVAYHGNTQAELSIPFTRITKQDGSRAGLTADEVVTYLNAEFANDPFAGGGGGGGGGGAVAIPELAGDPVMPALGDTWVRRTVLNPMGTLQAFFGGFPSVTKNDEFRFDLSYQTTVGTKRVQLT